jgi:hypothetical protein
MVGVGSQKEETGKDLLESLELSLDLSLSLSRQGQRARNRAGLANQLKRLISPSFSV